MSTTFQTTSRTSYGKFSIVVTENSTNISSNTSDLTIELKYTSADQYYCGVSNFTITDSTGSVLGSYSRSYGVVKNISKGTQTLKTFSNLQANHLNDGTGSISLQISYRIGNTTTYEDSFSFTLTKIPRASLISCTNSITITSTSTGTASVTVTPQTTGFYHIVTYASVGSGVTATTPLVNKVLINSATTFNVSKNDLLAVVTKGTVDTVIFTCTTYSDSACTVQVGSPTTASINVNLDSTLAPTLTISSVSVSTSTGKYSIPGYLITDGKTVPVIRYASNLATGATLSSIRFTPNAGIPVTTTQANPENGLELNTISRGSLTSDVTYTVNYLITDSRGFASSGTYISDLTCYAYSPPMARITAYRTASTGTSDPTMDPAGSRLYYKLTGIISSIDGQNSIVADVTKTYIQAGSNSAQQINAVGYNIPLPISSSITVKALVTDSVSSSTTPYTWVTVGPAIFPLDLYDDSLGNVGVGFGTIAESGKVKSSLEAIFNHNNSIITNSNKLMIGEMNPSNVLITSPLAFVSNGGKGTFGELAQDKNDDVSVGFSSSTGGFIGGSSTANHTGFVTLYGTGSGSNKVVSGNTSGSTYVNTLPAKTGTIAMTSDIPTLPSTVTASSVITRSSGATVNYSHAKRYGNVITIYCQMFYNTDVTSGHDIFTGTLNSAYYPPYDVETCCYYTSHSIGVRIQPDGTITVRNASDSLVNIGTTVGIFWSVTYVVG